MAARKDTDSEVPVVRASARYVRLAPRKARMVADQVRGLSVPEARTLLDFSPRGAAHDISKLIASAAANAEANHELVADDLRVSEIFVDEGPTLKRWRARARGRAVRIRKPTCHITVLLAERAGPATSAARKPAEAPDVKAPSEPKKTPKPRAKRKAAAEKKETTK